MLAGCSSGVRRLADGGGGRLRQAAARLGYRRVVARMANRERSTAGAAIEVCAEPCTGRFVVRV